MMVWKLLNLYSKTIINSFQVVKCKELSIDSLYSVWKRLVMDEIERNKNFSLSLVVFPKP